MNAGGMHSVPITQKDLTPNWSRELQAQVSQIDYEKLKDRDFWAWMGNAELQRKHTLTLPDVPVARVFTVEEARGFGLDDATFRPGQAFSGTKFGRKWLVATST